MKKIGKAIARKFKNWKGATTAKGDDIEESRAMPADVEEVKVEIKKQTSVDKATETDTQLCEDINENSEEAQNDSTTVEPTLELCLIESKSVDRAESPSSTEPCFDSDDAEEKPSTRQRQAIVAGVVGAALLVSSIVAYILKMYAIAVIGGIVGLACIGFALYNIINPNTKLEKVKSVEQPIVESSLNPI